MRAICRSGVAFAVVLLACRFSVADLTAKPNAYTEHDRVREQLEWNQKTILEPYRQVGNKNAAWDAEATAFLEACVQFYARSGFGPLAKGDSPTRDELIKLAEAAVKKGCDDPLVLYFYGGSLMDSPRKDESKPVLQQAYKGLLQSKYPDQRTYHAANRLLRVTDNVKDRLEITAELDKLRIKTLYTKFINSAHRRTVADAIWRDFPNTPAKRQSFFDQAMKDPRTDKWIVNLFGGRHYVKAAWDARGGGWANQVKQEGWRGFEQNLEKARECLTVAWKLAPNLPEAPAEMLSVAMGQGQRGQNELRTWFDRAIDAQFDYHDAYSKLRWALYPRWLGSHEDILALGIECYRTGRYDTGVPYQLIDSLEAIREDRGGDMSLWDKPEMYDMIKDIMVTYAEKLKDKPDWHRWYITYAAALANRNEKHDESVRFLQQIDDRIVEKVYTDLHRLPRESVSESYMRTSPLADRYQQAVDLRKAEEYEQAAAAFQKIVDELPKKDKRLVTAQFHLDSCQDVLKLAAGESVDLSPRVDLTPWGIWSGNWSSPKQGELLGIAGPQGLIALPSLSVPPRYEFSAECEIRRQDLQSPSAGFIINFTGWQNAYPGVWVYPADKKIFTRGSEDKWHDNITCGDKFKLTVQVIDDTATVILDGREVAKFSGVARPGAKKLGIGLTGMFQLPEGTVVFREVRVRKIEKNAGEK